MKYRLIDTPGFPVKHVSELKEGDGDVVYVDKHGIAWQAWESSRWRSARNVHDNPTGLVARAFEVVRDEWTWEVVRSPISGLEYIAVRFKGEYACQFTTTEAAAEYCEWKNGGNDGK